MPYKVSKQNCKQSSGKKGKYVLKKKDTNEKVSCHTSKKKAKSAMRARYANETHINENDSSCNINDLIIKFKTEILSHDEINYIANYAKSISYDELIQLWSNLVSTRNITNIQNIHKEIGNYIVDAVNNSRKEKKMIARRQKFNKLKKILRLKENNDNKSFDEYLQNALDDSSENSQNNPQGQESPEADLKMFLSIIGTVPTRNKDVKKLEQ